MQDLDFLKEKVHRIPYCPGVYIMHDKDGAIIYIGKSKSLRNRLGQYFLTQSGHTPKTAKMVSCVYDFETIVTKSEFEALVLECSLIKKYKPKYNILLKDDKGYSYIRFTLNDEFPRLSVVTKPVSDNAKYFGPYLSRGSAKNAIAALSDALKLPTCPRKFPRDIKKERPCLNYHLNKCIAPCTGNISLEQFREVCEQANLLLTGKYESLSRKIEEDMNKAADALLFERAAALRDRLAAVKKIGQQQNVLSGAFSDTDVIGFSCSTVKCCVVVLHYIKGRLLSKETQVFDGHSICDAGDILSQFIIQYYEERHYIPDEILVSHETDNISDTEKWLCERSGHKVCLHVPKRGDKLRLIELAVQNALTEAVQRETSEQRDSKLLTLIADLLGLDAPPVRIEAYDISNTSGENIVAGMVVFENARPKRSEYRKFGINSFDNQNDTACIAEVIARRFSDMINKKEHFEKCPDLVLIDGGEGQLHAAMSELERLNLNIPVFGMVKDDKHRTRGIITPSGNEIGLLATPAAFSFIGRIQEEVHRFSIEFHRKLRNKKNYTSALDKIEGIGEKRKLALLKHFKSITAIKDADIETLSSVVPRSIAEKIKNMLN